MISFAGRFDENIIAGFICGVWLVGELPRRAGCYPFESPVQGGKGMLGLVQRRNGLWGSSNEYV